MTTRTAKRSSRRSTSPVEVVTLGHAERVLGILGVEPSPSSINLARTLLDVLVRACRKVESQEAA